ncbi:MULTISPECIES: GNAT family N-acetyltransferase [unclassified Streptomyces]|uniref:GNAT family N-acetyltransferase n=1 Tax=Streptomyces sp. NPDC059755 TaxID=3346934 RepID=UPI0036590CB0
MRTTAARTLDGPVRVTPVHDRARRREFIRLPYQLYRGEPCWVPPLESERRAFLNRHKNPFFDFGDAELFLAHRHGRPVGRIAAVHNPRHNSHHGGTDGFFGLFECADDTAAAQALFEAAGTWLRARGLTSALGPVSFSTNGECGTLVDGFSTAPAVLMPYNPPHHDALLRACGLTKAKDLWAWEWTTHTPEDAAVTKVAQWAQRRSGVHVRPLDLRDLDAEEQRLRDIYTDAWEHNWGFVPPTEREFHHLTTQLRQIVRPELVLLAEVHGDPAAFCLAVPDANQALKAAGGRLTRYGLPIGLVRAARAARRIDWCRLIALGVKAQYRNQGLDALLYTRLAQAGRQLGYRGGELSWVLEDNTAMNQAIARMGAQRSKTYRIYQRPL